MTKLEKDTMVDQEMIAISKEEYAELVADVEFLGCLHAAGVDSWEGYEDAQEMMDG
jgi:hypothetical protein